MTKNSQHIGMILLFVSIAFVAVGIWQNNNLFVIPAFVSFSAFLFRHPPSAKESWKQILKDTAIIAGIMAAICLVGSSLPAIDAVTAVGVYFALKVVARIAAHTGLARQTAAPAN